MENTRKSRGTLLVEGTCLGETDAVQFRVQFNGIQNADGRLFRVFLALGDGRSQDGVTIWCVVRFGVYNRERQLRIDIN